MPEPEPKPSTVPISDLPAEERAARSSSFGGVATDYERFRPGPPLAAVDWYLPEPVRRVVDLGAGTGALTRLLLDRAEEVAAVEPDDRMRSVLAERVPGANALAGRGEAIPMPDDSVDAVIAATSWHWMEVEPTLREVGRILVPGGVLGAVWSAPDVEGAFFTQARELLASGGQGADTATAADPTIAGLIGDNPDPTATTLAIPRGFGFEAPEHQDFRWSIALNADELIGLLGTISWIITMPSDRRARVTAEARRLLGEVLGVVGDVTVDIEFKADAWRTRFTG